MTTVSTHDILRLEPLGMSRTMAHVVAAAESGLIGRAKECSVCLAEIDVSRRHASVTKKDDGWYVTDLGSRHGTFLNGVQLERDIALRLNNGDLLRIGGSRTLRVVLCESSDTVVEEDAEHDESLLTISTQQHGDLDAGQLLRASMDFSNQLAAVNSENELFETTCRYLCRALRGVLRSACVIVAPDEDSNVSEVLARCDRSAVASGDGVIASAPLHVSRRVLRSASEGRDAVIFLRRSHMQGTIDATVPDAVQTVAATLIDRIADGRAILLYGLGERQFAQGEQWAADYLGLVARLTRQHLLSLRRTRLCKYFSPAVVKVLMQRDATNHIECVPCRTTATSLFFDIRGFSVASEGWMDDMLALHGELADMLSIVTEEVFASGGTVLDYHGDGMFAAWGVPFEQPDQADRAVRCALRILDRVNRTDLTVFRSSRESGACACGIGIARGPVLAGPVGSRDQFKYGILGPSVNEASRLEALTKRERLDAPILMSQSVYEALGDSKPCCCRVGNVQMAGMQSIVPIWEIMTDESDESGRMNETQIEIWHDVLARLEASRAIDDLNAIESAARNLPDADPRARWLARTIDELRDEDKLRRWDGTIRFEQK